MVEKIEKKRREIGERVKGNVGNYGKCKEG